MGVFHDADDDECHDNIASDGLVLSNWFMLIEISSLKRKQKQNSVYYTRETVTWEDDQCT